MKLDKSLEILDRSWSREDVLLKIKNGIEPDSIVKEFIDNNKQNIQNLSNLIRPKDRELLVQIEKLSTSEAKLINEIKNMSDSKIKYSNFKKEGGGIHIKKINSSYKLGLFMINWSNKFVFIVLLAISVIALSKQAWA